jgi:protease-4
MSRAFLAALLGLCACDPRIYAKPNADEPKPKQGHDKGDGDKNQRDEEPAPAPSPLAALGMLGQNRGPGPWEEPRQAGPKDKDHAAVLELDGNVTELDAPFSFSLLGGGVRESIPMRKLVVRLRELDADAKVPAILLRLRAVRLSTAAAEELGATLASLKKPTFCHFEAAENLEVVLLARCRSVAVAPTGEAVLSGPALIPIYLKGLLDLLNVQADFIHIGAFKGAAEPLTRTEPSPEMRRTYDDILDGAYARMVDGVAAGRHVAPDKVKAWIDQATFSADEAKAAGLVDEVATWEAFRDARSGGAWKRLDIEDKTGSDVMSLLGLRPKKKVTGSHVALLYAVGEVKDGKGGPLGAFEEITSGRLVPAVRAAAADDDVKAIVLRVDSPGGSALASETIWQAVHEAVAKKPVVVSMGAVAASGGYYISSGATRIFAAPDTLTGSIGVIGGKIVYGPALAKIGITGVEMARGKRALLYTPLRKWSDDERKVVTDFMLRVYGTFKGRVAEGRKLAVADVEKIAQGRVWTGADAKDRGLVDELGTLENALAYARTAGGLKDDAPVDVYPPEPTLLDIIANFGGGSRVSLVGQALAALPGLPAERRAALAQALEAALRFGGEPVRAVALLPVVR